MFNARSMLPEYFACKLTSVRYVQTYDGERFVSGGFAMHELFFPDGSCPSDSILQQFLKIAEGTDGRALCGLCVSHMSSWISIPATL